VKARRYMSSFAPYAAYRLPLPSPVDFIMSSSDVAA
jgi:hypothetical protein